MASVIRGSDEFDSAVIEDTGWNEMSSGFLNSWVNYGSGYANARYCRVNGVVHIEGLVKSGTIGAAIFILPAEFRPTGRLILTGMSNNVASRFDIQTDGSIIMYSGSNSWYSITCNFSVT